MPQKIICSGCGFIFYEGDDLVYPEDVLKKYEYKCPRCGRTLNLNPERIEVRKASGTQPD